MGKEFVKNNNNKCKLIIKNKKWYLKGLFQINNIKEDKLNIYLTFHKDICNVGYMFNTYEYLLEFSVYNDYQVIYERNYFPEIENENIFERIQMIH